MLVILLRPYRQAAPRQREPPTVSYELLAKADIGHHHVPRDAGHAGQDRPHGDRAGMKTAPIFINHARVTVVELEGWLRP